MTLSSPRRIRAGQDGSDEPGGHLSGPYGTVSACLHPAEGILRIFTVPEPDEADWNWACGLIRQVAAGNLHPAGQVDGGEDVIYIFEVQAVPSLLEAVCALCE